MHRKVPPPVAEVARKQKTGGPPETGDIRLTVEKPPRRGLTAKERDELEAIQRSASEEEKEMEELQRLMQAQDAAIARLEQQKKTK